MADEGEGGSRGVRLGKAGYAVLAALILLIGNAVQLTWTLDPSRKPDPNERLHAAIEPESAEAKVTLGTYLRRITAAREIEQALDAEVQVADRSDRQAFLCARERKLSVRGYVVYANLTVEGLKHRQVDLVTAVYDGATRRRLSMYEGESPAPPQRLTSPTDSFVQAVFLEVPPQPRRKYYARFELRTHAPEGELGTLLAVADSKAFPGFLPPENETYPHCPAQD